MIVCSLNKTSITYLPCRREGEGHNTICQHYDDRHILFQRNGHHSSVYVCGNESRFSLTGIGELLLVPISRFQCLFGREQHVGYDMAKVFSVGGLLHISLYELQSENIHKKLLGTYYTRINSLLARQGTHGLPCYFSSRFCDWLEPFRLLVNAGAFSATS